MRTRRWLQRGAALLMLLAFLVGVPFAVLTTVGLPGPMSARWRSVWSTGRLGTDAVVQVGAVLFAVLWAWFAVTALAEVVQVVRARRCSTPLAPTNPTQSPTSAVRALVRFIAVGSIVVGTAAAPWPSGSMRQAAAHAHDDVRLSRGEERLRATLGVGADAPVVAAALPGSSPSASEALPVGLAAAGAGSAVVLVAGAVAAIDRRRRQQLRVTPNGARPAPMSIEQVRLEMQLRALADVRQLARLDEGVVDAVAEAATVGTRPSVVTVSPKGVATTLAAVPGDATRAVMAHVGSTADGQQVFVDLEAVGVLSVVSPVADDVVATVAASVLTSQQFRGHTMVSAGVHVDHLGAAPVVQCQSLVDAIEAAARNCAEASTAVVAGRVEADDPMRPWLASVVGSGAGVGAVVAGDVPGSAATLRATDDGHVLEPVGVELTPVAMSADQRRELAALVEAAGAPPEAIGTVVPITRGVAAASATPPDWSFMVRVLGRVAVTTAVGDEVRFERAKSLELLVWQVHHRNRPARSAARAALWDTNVSDATFANVVSAARRALDRAVPPAAGGHWLGKITADLMPLNDAVVSDAEVLLAAVEAARSLPPRDAVAVLRPAVELIEGMPFAGTGYLWPDAEGITSWLVLLATGAAADLAALHLSLGDVDGVFWATGRGLAVLSGHEELIALRMRAHARRGDLAGVRAEWDCHVRALAADSWSPASPSPKLVALRAELLEGAAAG